MTILQSPLLRSASLAAALLAAGALAGCTSYVSRGLSDDGQARELVFPKVEDSATLPEGTFPNLDNLRNVGAGLTKSQLYDLLGPPHFQEGMFAVREWDYLFQFRTATGITSCQYKVIFDTQYKARSFHWLPESCAGVLRSEAVAAPAPVPLAVPTSVAPQPTRSFRLAADSLFAFNKGGVADILPAGRAALERLAADLKGAKYERVEVTGHADRLGSTDYNQQLSEQRAQSVRSLLVTQGVAAERISASGRGEQQPVVQCAQAAHAQLVECLAPNRRVDVLVQVDGPTQR